MHYTYSPRGLLDRVGGSAPDPSWLYYNRTFVDDIGCDEFGQRSSRSTGQSGENQVETSYGYDDRRRLTDLASVLNPGSAEPRTLILNAYEKSNRLATPRALARDLFQANGFRSNKWENIYLLRSGFLIRS